MSEEDLEPSCEESVSRCCLLSPRFFDFSRSWCPVIGCWSWWVGSTTSRGRVAHRLLWLYLMLTDLIDCRPVPVQLTSLYGEVIEAFLQLRNNTAVTWHRLPIFWEKGADTFVGHHTRFFDTSEELGSFNFRFKSIVKEARETVALFCHRLSIFPFTDEMKIFHPSVGVGRKSGGILGVEDVVPRNIHLL